MDSHQANTHPGTILVVDDEPHNLRLLAAMLEKQGYEVRTVISASMALRSVSLNIPDLILLDINLPEMNGYEVCQRLKSMHQTRSIPIIFISALNEAVDKMRAFTAGGVDYIIKPFQIEEVVARVRTHLTLQHVQKQLEEWNAQLQQEIYERRRAETSLRQLVGELERRNYEMHLLNQMSDILQRSQSLDKAYASCEPLLRQLFPEQDGALYIASPDSQHFNMVLHWGQVPPHNTTLHQEMFKVFEHTTMHLMDEPDEPLLSLCCGDSTRFPVMCAMLSTHQEPLGVLYLCNTPGQQDKAFHHWRSLVSMVADRLTLMQANLRLREQLLEQSIRDPLTELYNRRYMNEMLTRELASALRQRHPVGVIMADIDHFKRYNDTHGHMMGDRLLRAVGAFLRANTRQEDIVCRYGGEEFVIIMPGALPEDTQRRAEMLRTEIKQLSVNHDDLLPEPVSLSLGVAGVPVHGISMEEVIDAADQALYRAKSWGRDCVVIASQSCTSNQSTVPAPAE